MVGVALALALTIGFYGGYRCTRYLVRVTSEGFRPSRPVLICSIMAFALAVPLAVWLGITVGAQVGGAMGEHLLARSGLDVWGAAVGAGMGTALIAGLLTSISGAGGTFVGLLVNQLQRKFERHP